MTGGETFFGVTCAIRGSALWCYRGAVVEVLRPWGPDAGAWRGQASFAPKINVAAIEDVVREAALERRPNYARRRQATVCQFLRDAWPEWARDITRPFGGGHWQIFQFLNFHGRRARQLLTSNAALGFATAQLAAAVPPGEIDDLLSARRRVLAARCGFPESETAVRALAKARPAWITADTLERLRQVLCDADACEALAHLPAVNEPLLAIAIDAQLRSALSQRCLRQIGRLRTDVGQFDVVERAREAIARRATAAPIADLRDLDRPLPCPAVTQPAPAPRTRKLEFPAPPLPDTGDIQAIRTHADLRAEGRIMDHCCGTNRRYAREVAAGSGYFYRMLRPERATIYLIRRADKWKIEQVSRVRNAPVSTVTRNLIERWVSGQLVEQPKSLSLEFARFRASAKAASVVGHALACDPSEARTDRIAGPTTSEGQLGLEF